MSARTKLGDDLDAGRVRALAKASRDAAQTRRLLALALIYDGGSHLDAAQIGDLRQSEELPDADTVNRQSAAV